MPFLPFLAPLITHLYNNSRQSLMLRKICALLLSVAQEVFGLWCGLVTGRLSDAADGGKVENSEYERNFLFFHRFPLYFRLLLMAFLPPCQVTAKGQASTLMHRDILAYKR